MKWLSSMMTDSHNSSVSSKRVVTFFAFILCGVSFMVDQLTEHKANTELFNSMMYIVIAGLGFTAAEKFSPKGKSNE